MVDSIIRKDMFHIDEYLISSFCINTIKASNKTLDKFVLFNKNLNSFHDDGTIYEQSFEDYSNYLIYQIVKDSLLMNKNILEYESYLYNVLTSFSAEKLNKKVNAKNIARVWHNLLSVMSFIMDQSSLESVLKIEYFPEIVINKRHINTRKMNSNYYIKPTLILYFKEGVEIINLLPSHDNHTVFNINTQELIKYFGKRLLYMHTFELNNNFNCKLSSIKISKSLLNTINKSLDDQYIDFKKINNHNCNICPLTCSVKELLYTRYEALPYNDKRRLIKVYNI